MEKRKIKVFLDSNVILSGLISDRSYPRIILDLSCLNLDFIQFLTGRYNMMEIERNLKKKLPRAIDVYKKYIPLLHIEIVPLPSESLVKKISKSISPKDAPVLASAIEAKVDIIVTGDKKDFGELKTSRIHPLKILTPAEFINDELPQVIQHL